MERRKWTALLPVVALAVALSLSGAVSALAAAGVFRIMHESDPGGSKLDPGLGFSQYAPNLYLGLGRISPKNEYIPGAAASYDVSEDGQTYVFHLRDDIYWSDGTPLTAHDFEYAWKRALDPAFGSTRAFMLYLVEGAREYHTGQGSVDDVAVRALDDRTLEVRLVSPASFFPMYASANNIYFPVPRHVVEKYGKDWVLPENHVSSGPFKIKEWRPDLYLSLVPNELYPLEQPKIAELIVNVVPQPAVALSKYENDELDFAWNLPVGEMARLRNDPQLSQQLGAFVEANQAGLQFNQNYPPLDNPLVRQAIAMAVDPDPIIQGPLQGLVQRAGSLFVPTVPGGRDNVALPYDPETARQLLKEAGYQDPRDVPTITMVVRAANPTGLMSAQAVQAMLQYNLGISVEVQALESAAYYDQMYSGQIPLALSGPFALTPDPYDLFNVLQGQLHDYQNWFDPEWDAKLAEATGESDPERRLALYHELEDYIVRETTIFQPVYNGMRHAIQKPYVSNYLGWDERNMWILSHEYVEVNR